MYFPQVRAKKQINKQNSYLLLAFLQSGSVPELDMHESKHFLPGQFVHSEHIASQWDLQLIFLMHNSDPVLTYEATGRAFFGSLHHLEKIEI
jgi:mRNA-degrading endonuclease YafQ of YafQ-DinJ toxin-antitoxin module